MAYTNRIIYWSVGKHVIDKIKKHQVYVFEKKSVHDVNILVLINWVIRNQISKQRAKEMIPSSINLTFQGKRKFVI
jgi:hypothetical protein